MPALFERLDVWKLAHELALEVYRVTSRFPRNEQYGLTSQLRRAAVGVPSNIAEGNARKHRAEYLQFCHFARGSVAEVMYLLRLSSDLALINHEEYRQLFAQYDRLGAMLQSMISKLASKAGRGSPPSPGSPSPLVP